MRSCGEKISLENSKMYGKLFIYLGKTFHFFSRRAFSISTCMMPTILCVFFSSVSFVLFSWILSLLFIFHAEYKMGMKTVLQHFQSSLKMFQLMIFWHLKRRLEIFNCFLIVSRYFWLVYYHPVWKFQNECWQGVMVAVTAVAASVIAAAAAASTTAIATALS